MKKERILEMIDNNIIKMLNDQSFDQVRSKLFYTSKKFRQRLNTDFNIIDIDKVKDSRTKYTMMYIDLSEKRIADLVRIIPKISKLECSKFHFFNCSRNFVFII